MIILRGYNSAIASSVCPKASIYQIAVLTHVLNFIFFISPAVPPAPLYFSPSLSNPILSLAFFFSLFLPPLLPLSVSLYHRCLLSLFDSLSLSSSPHLILSFTLSLPPFLLYYLFLFTLPSLPSLSCVTLEMDLICV